MFVAASLVEERVTLSTKKNYVGKHRDPEDRRASRRQMKCTACDGSGVYANYNKNKLENCPVCKGSGKVSD